MAGYIFAVSKEMWCSVKEENIKKGYFTPFTPSIEIEIVEQGKTRSRKNVNKILLSTFGDFITMKPGDNVYFLSNRKIYGVGHLIKIGDDCKYDNYKGASKLFPNCLQEENKEYLTTVNNKARWVIFFEPSTHFFTKGADMDDVLRYKPSSFKMLRAFEKLSFIKIDDEENRALKEFIYIINKVQNEDGENMYFEFDDSLHKKLEKLDLSDYIMDINKCLEDSENSEYLKCEMLVESALLQKMNRKELNIIDDWDYLTHQIIASPFKPLQYIDKIDIFGYRFLNEYPDTPKLISKYLVVEVKKDTINEETLGQIMRYVDWVCDEYASGDYSRVGAIVVGNRFANNIKDDIERLCTRDFILESHPVKTQRWNDIRLIKYKIEREILFESIDL